jgi:sterol desaturase/sphingolipid hydroxylase (fatty acid hydroxylase superfamily)
MTTRRARTSPAHSSPARTSPARIAPGPARAASGRLPAAAALAGAIGLLLLAERRSPRRPPTQAEPARRLRNLALGGLSLAVAGAVQRPLLPRLAARAEGRRLGLAQRLPGPAWVRDAAAFLAMDYAMYGWHVLTHKVPALWRLHLVHHVDLDLDASTALRFHALDMLVSLPFRAGQVVLLGASPRALRWWQSWFFVSILFHHANLRLPDAIERRLSRVLTTPAMHGIHHSAVRGETESNWSSGLSLWDHLHGTFRRDIAPSRVVIGVPAYRDPVELRLVPSLRMPFATQRDAWVPPRRSRIT